MELTIRDVCRLFGVPENTVLRWIGERQLPARLLNSNYHFHRAELLEWATLRKQPFLPEIFQPAEERVSSELTSALKFGGIVYDVQGTDKASVLRSVVRWLPLPDGFDRDDLLDLYLARETLSSTSIGDGIALPHPRHPLLCPGAPASVTLCFPKTPIPFGAEDGKDVHALFATVAPNPRIHLHLVARLGLATADPRIQDALARRADRKEILAEFQRLEAGFRSTGRYDAPETKKQAGEKN